MLQDSRLTDQPHRPDIYDAESFTGKLKAVQLSSTVKTTMTAAWLENLHFINIFIFSLLKLYLNKKTSQSVGR